MEVIYLLIPVSLLLIGLIVYFLFWAVRSGQFDDMEGSGYRILLDNDDAEAEQETMTDKDEGKE